METVQYIILAFVLILIFGPAILVDRSPIPETSGNVYKIGKSSELDALLSSTAHVVIDFYADWCPPCRAIAPTFSKLADDCAVTGQLAFAKVNVDHAKDVAKRYNITSMPTFLFFENGEPKPVAITVKKRSAPDGMTEERLIEKVQGADIHLLNGVVQTLAGKVHG
ncbi:thioredoxin-domain-containing protein [Penicillium bovifimosum]|uniref:Thioredoxin-domain-containing protein n=1 Tax=Penicillium bovifimosum TaxID=126998 RepID=A0A9W9GLR7_9EURO|nr:thioredoxin-domain-containing protein [Penicillium bovifimosum]KAJ5123995.1 thioredoxin-domain-containing protein [Penicillium bovifimosum]